MKLRYGRCNAIHDPKDWSRGHFMIYSTWCELFWSGRIKRRRHVGVEMPTRKWRKLWEWEVNKYRYCDADSRWVRNTRRMPRSRKSMQQAAERWRLHALSRAVPLLSSSFTLVSCQSCEDLWRAMMRAIFYNFLIGRNLMQGRYNIRTADPFHKDAAARHVEIK